MTDVCSQSCGIQRCGPHQEMIESSLALKWSLKKPWTIHQPFWQFEETTGWKKNQDVLSQKLYHIDAAYCIDTDFDFNDFWADF